MAQITVRVLDYHIKTQGWHKAIKKDPQLHVVRYEPPRLLNVFPNRLTTP